MSYSDARLDSKTVVVTGCNTGIGKETVLDFYKRGARVLMACRDIKKAEEAKKEIEERCQDGKDGGTLKVVKLDLSSLNSVRKCAEEILSTEPQVNILLNNAGVMMCPKSMTEDGFEMHLGTNHLGHFLLTLLLLPRIRNSTPARIVNVSSDAYKFNAIDFNDMHYEKKRYSAMGAYAQSKFANILFTKELAKRLKDHNINDITTYCLHPGVIATELSRHMDQTIFPGFQWLWRRIARPFIKSAELGAKTQIRCAVHEECARESGLYYKDCVPVSLWKTSIIERDADKLWEASLQLVKLGNYDPFKAQDLGLKPSPSKQLT